MDHRSNYSSNLQKSGDHIYKRSLHIKSTVKCMYNMYVMYCLLLFYKTYIK
jgi:hypothetical protein